jgi:predicted acylesterase/phospholipase RssA
MSDELGPSIVAASAAFPGLPPVLIDGEPFVDGGYVQSRPLQPAWEAGATVMHVIYHRRDFSDILLRRSDNLVDVLDELFHAGRATLFEQDLQLVRDINRGLAFLEKPDPQSWPGTEEVRGVLRIAGRLTQVSRNTAPFRKLIVHRHHPVQDLSGAFGAANFTRENIEGLIRRGFLEVVRHDCAASGCIIPD